ncbi:hypothetical protein QI30_06475 [Kurthia sp. 3B1D]|uniref:Sel1 repeat family protein n=1 Tax=Candidatus Kurthia intestinigallinarum TaxID=1562256 RepID=A0A433RVB0_9BACL|nr:tetratricopeptide repeat protein [Kurthia sp. 3B1D]RUS57222.1 hypothetical protein QI30_06475 [Kurthia sp. 3B1D]
MEFNKQTREQLLQQQLAAIHSDTHVLIKKMQQELQNPSGDQSEPVFIDDVLVAEAVNLLQQSVANQKEAQYELGHLYRGIGMMALSVSCFELAADNGYLAAMYWLGNFYYEGIGVDENIEKAFSYYEYAAKAGLADAMNNYADMYFRGETVPQNDEIAYHWFSKAAMLGVSESMFTLGYMFENGVGVELDEETSLYWFEQAANNGDLYAANYLGHKAMQRAAFDEAFIWYLQAATGQDVEGEYNVGFCYEEGIGTMQNLQKAKYWYQRAALQGDTQAKEKLARF